MSSAVDVINNLVQIGRTLRDVAELVKDAKTKNLIADLNLALADLKMQVATLQEENLDLKKKIKGLESSDDVRSQLTIKKGNYWFISKPLSGYSEGPFCTGCFDSNKKLITLTKLPFNIGVGEYQCPVCKHVS
ncbi:MAG: hypothetical protein ABSE81_02795 [Candidatus Omnitrophota bacterium]|jgi:hypothetical protein